LVEEFTTRVPELVFNPAEILLFLLEYRQQLPGEAIDNVEAWMTRIREER
jgi:hypothetical protein